MEEDRESIIDIDLNNLEKEWADQPKLYLKYAEILADKRFQHAEAKAQIKVVEAEVLLRIRRNPTKYDITKASEKAYTAAVAIHEDVQAAITRANKKAYQVDMYEAMVRALEHRKAALEDEVRMMLSGLNAEPRAPKGSREEMDEAVKRQVRHSLKKGT